jgi:hypothetical protein
MCCQYKKEQNVLVLIDGLLLIIVIFSCFVRVAVDLIEANIFRISK